MTGECEAAAEELSDRAEREIMARLESMIERAVSKAVRHELKTVGLYADTPEQQAEIGKDLRHLNLWRRAFERAAVVIGTAVLMLLTGGVVAIFWLGFKLHLLKAP